MITPAASAPQPPGQMPAAPGAGPAPVPFGGDQSASNPPLPPASLPYGTPGVEVMNGAAGPYVHQSSLVAPNVNPYEAGSLSPIDVHGDADAGGRDDVAGTVGGAVAAAQARFAEHQADTHGLGSTIGDLMALPPKSPLDPGVGSLGEATPTGAYYDPPRNYGG